MPQEREEVKLKIISDGTAHGTKVVNIETGEMIDRVMSVKWQIDTDTSMATVELLLAIVPVEVVGESE